MRGVLHCETDGAFKYEGPTSAEKGKYSLKLTKESDVVGTDLKRQNAKLPITFVIKSTVGCLREGIN